MLFINLFYLNTKINRKIHKNSQNKKKILKLMLRVIYIV